MGVAVPGFQVLVTEMADIDVSKFPRIGRENHRPEPATAGAGGGNLSDRIYFVSCSDVSVSVRYFGPPLRIRPGVSSEIISFRRLQTSDLTFSFVVLGFLSSAGVRFRFFVGGIGGGTRIFFPVLPCTVSTIPSIFFAVNIYPFDIMCFE